MYFSAVFQVSYGKGIYILVVFQFSYQLNSLDAYCGHTFSPSVVNAINSPVSVS